MNILYINHYAGSPALGTEHRRYYLVRERGRAGRQAAQTRYRLAHEEKKLVQLYREVLA